MADAMPLLRLADRVTILTVEGATVEGLIERLLDNSAVSYVHAHNARRGCYSGLITRA